MDRQTKAALVNLASRAEADAIEAVERAEVALTKAREALNSAGSCRAYARDGGGGWLRR